MFESAAMPDLHGPFQEFQGNAAIWPLNLLQVARSLDAAID